MGDGVAVEVGRVVGEAVAGIGDGVAVGAGTAVAVGPGAGARVGATVGVGAAVGDGAGVAVTGSCAGVAVAGATVEVGAGEATAVVARATVGTGVEAGWKGCCCADGVAATAGTRLACEVGARTGEGVAGASVPALFDVDATPPTVRVTAAGAAEPGPSSGAHPDHRARPLIAVTQTSANPSHAPLDGASRCLVRTAARVRAVGLRRVAVGGEGDPFQSAWRSTGLIGLPECQVVWRLTFEDEVRA